MATSEPPAKRQAVLKLIGEEHKFFCYTRERLCNGVLEKETLTCNKSEPNHKNESPLERWERTGHTVHEKSSEEQRLSTSSAMESLRNYEASRGEQLKKKSHGQQQRVITSIACFMQTFFPDAGFSKMLSIWSNSTKDTPHTLFVACEESAFLSMINVFDAPKEDIITFNDSDGNEVNVHGRENGDSSIASLKTAMTMLHESAQQRESSPSLSRVIKERCNLLEKKRLEGGFKKRPQKMVV
jgi:hypothetical protein